MHLTDADLGAVLDPAGGGDRGNAARMHAAACTACRDAVESARGADQDVASLLCDLDHPLPEPDFASVRVRAALAQHPGESGWDRESGATDAVSPGANLRLIVPGPTRGRQAAGKAVSDTISNTTSRAASHVASHVGSHVAVAVRRGAVILALAAAAAAAAVPNSPARRLVARWFAPRRVSHQGPVTSIPASPAPSVAAPPPPVEARGVAIIPSGRVELVFRVAQPVGEIDIRPTTSRRVAVTATGEGPTYSVGRDILSIDNRGGSLLSYDVELPAVTDLPVVSIRIGGRTVFSRQGATLVTSAVRQPDGSYRLAMSGADPSSR